MCAEPAPYFDFIIGDVSFHIEKSEMEMFPGIGAEIITIDYEIPKNQSGAAIWIR